MLWSKASSLINLAISSQRRYKCSHVLNQLQRKDDSQDLGLIYSVRAEILVSGCLFSFGLFLGLNGLSLIFQAEACLGMHMHMHVHLHIHIHIHVHIIDNNTYIHTYIHSFIHTYIHTYLHTYIHTYIRPSVHPFIRPCVHPSIRPSIQRYIAK